MSEKSKELTPSQIKIVQKYVTNTSSDIFALRDLPEVVKGALFSRYSRSSSGLLAILLKDFILNEETGFDSLTSKTGEQKEEDQGVAIKRAQNFYDRILDGYGDDSIGELGGAHLAIENVSMIAAKIIEDCRIGGSPLEKSTRYIYFDQKYEGNYLFYREPVLMTSAYRTIYVDTCNRLFETYGRLIPPLSQLIEKKFPKSCEVSKTAYTAALRAKVLDCLRGLLPASALTNLGLHGNGRFFENLIQKLNCHDLTELNDIARSSYQELEKIVPSFIRRADPAHKYHKTFAEFKEKTSQRLRFLSKRYRDVLHPLEHGIVRLIDYTEDAPTKIGAGLLFPYCQSGLWELREFCNQLPKEELNAILEAGATFRHNRRHKSPRALEQAEFTFEIVADFGVYRDLQRHRILSQERQLLTCDLGYFTPQEICGSDMEKEYHDAMQQAKEVYDEIASQLPEEAQYVVPMAYNIHWYFHINLRSLQWLCELRSSPAGHPTYRYLAQEMAKQVTHVFPEFEVFFQFVDYDGYELGRLGQETRVYEKLKSR